MQNDWKVQVSNENNIIKYQNLEYHIEQMLGTGASAKVYKSKKFINSIEQKEEVALRIQNRYYKQNYEQWNQLKDFKWKNTTYPIENIPGSFLYTEFELFDGNLTSLGSQDLKTNIFKIAQTIAYALSEIHKSNFIHYDVKPDNIVFKKIKDQEFKFALCDFSSIQTLEKAKSEELFIEATPQFAPPEIQIQGISKDTDESSDIWSLGMTLYNLYSQHFMFTQDNLDQKQDQNFIDNIVEKDIQDNQQLKQLILLLLRVEKKDRIKAYEIIEFIQDPNKLKHKFAQIQPKQTSQNSCQQLYSTQIKKEKVKQPNLEKIPKLLDFINNENLNLRKKISHLLEIPNIVF
ncbi:unnamed protein product [Paramecium sonneborni]|uniref:Protein kinase domain-containing protein n=1 Tax=Paramecium sonneborni TaxID=65129 RepID=A0A8S1NJ50_9CILI|nr:unnamed protein product [Paramecium sonneborni]